MEKKKLITAQHPTRVYTCHIPAKDRPWTLNNQDQAGMILFLKDFEYKGKISGSALRTP
jgi:hypothetical protein